MYKLDKLDGSKYYRGEVIQAHRRGIIHIHGLSQGLTCRDVGWSIETLKTLRGESPATLVDGILRRLEATEKEWKGLQTIYDIEEVLSRFFDEGQDEKGLSRVTRKIVHEIDRRGLKAGLVLTLGDKSSSSKKDLIQKTFNSVLRDTLPSYPIPLYPIKEGFSWDNNEIEEAFKMAADHGFPYFLNRTDNEMADDLCPDPRVLYQSCQGPGAYRDGFGCIGKISLNLPLLAFQAGDEEGFLNRVGEVLELSGGALECKRALLEERLDRGDMPQTSKFLGSLDWQFSTIGIVGMNEALITLIEGTIASPSGKAITYKILELIRERLIELQIDNGHPYNLEASDERIGGIFALKDREKGFEIPSAGGDMPFYTHSTRLPVGYSDDLWEVLEHQYKFQRLYNGSAGFSIPLKEKIHSYEGCRLLAKGIVEHFGFPSFALSPTFSYCPVDGYLHGRREECPKCGGTPTIYAREGGRIQSLKEMEEIYREVYERRRPFVVVSRR